MGARIRLLRAALVAVALTLALAPATSADAFSQVYNYYRTHGNVAPCTFSAKTLQQALSAVPPDIQQYAPDFPAAIEAALQDRAQGACATKGSAVAPLVTTAPSTAPPSAPTPSSHAATAATPAPPASAVEAGLPIVAPAAKGGGTSNPPGPVVAIAILAGLLAISALIWAYARWRGVESAWLLGLGHALSEAGYRLESTWSEFTDWLRTGH